MTPIVPVTWSDVPRELETAVAGLRSDLSTYEARNPPEDEREAVQRAIHAACDEIESFIRGVHDLVARADAVVDERLLRTFKASVRDAVGKVDGAVKRELDKITSSLVGDVGFVFEEEEDPIVGEAALGQVRQEVHHISRSLETAGELDSLLAEFVNSRFRAHAHDVYVSMINSAVEAAGRKLTERTELMKKDLKGLMAEHAEAEGSKEPEVSPAKPPVGTSAPPPVVPRPRANTPPSTSARPQSVAVENVQERPPPTKPRPQTVAVPNGQPFPDEIQALPVPVSASPAARSKDNVQQTPVETPEDGGRNVNLMTDLNRMLAGGPPKVRRPTIGHSVDGESEIVNVDSEQQPLEEKYVGEEEQSVDMASERPVDSVTEPSVPDPKVPTPEPAPQQSPQPVSSPPLSQSTGNLSATPSRSQTLSQSAEKHKSPKSGFRGMLSSLTKSRPKAKKKGSTKAGENESSEAVNKAEGGSAAGSAEAIDAPPILQDTHVPSSPPPASIRAAEPSQPQTPPPVPARARGLSRRVSVVDLDDAHHPSHSKHPSSASADIDDGAATEIAHGSADALSHSTAEGDANEPPAVPPKSRRAQPTNAMSALASVMRGGTIRQHETGTSDGPGASNRMSMYSEISSNAGDRQSVYSEAAEGSQAEAEQPATAHDDTEDLTSPPPPIPRPRPPKATASHSPRPSSYLVESIETQGSTSPKPQPPVPSPVRRSMVLSGETSPGGSAEQLSSPVSPGPPIPRPRMPKAVPSHAPERPVSSYDRPVSNYSAQDRPLSSYSSSTDRPPSTYSTAATDRPLSVVSNMEHADIESTAPADTVIPPSDDNPEVEEKATQEKATPPPRPKKIPGVFATSHGALGALAAAVRGGAPPRPARPSHTASTESLADESEPSEPTHEEPPSPEVKPKPRPQHEAPPVTSRKPTNQQFFSSAPLVFKKKENSNSGDDKAIEKNALEWLNTNLSTHDIHVDNLYESLGNGLNLIYALESYTGESVGKYNKRAMLPVHRIDNIAVALNFCAKKGIHTQFLTPQGK
ncbi:hypothetical protein HK104_005860 [Borealophlyctis nickersoniae]|nr:hypothetical protein HK104_005860 [Borealophlyctis nickersoniae]